MSGDPPKLESWLNRTWYRPGAPPLWLRPLAALYAAGTGLRRILYARRWRRAVRLPVPVVVVGNLSVGGTGKTPLVCWLVEKLRERGSRPGVVSRGYRGSARHPRLVASHDDPGEVGDETVLVAERTGAPVAVGHDRPAAARLLLAAGCDVIVSDDGLQHYRLMRDCEIVVVDGERRFGNGWLLPAGPLRESRSRLASVDAVVVNGGRASSEHEIAMRLEARLATPLHGGASVPLAQFSGRAVHAVAGIGNPQRFFNMLRAHGIEVKGRALNDHARIAASDIEFEDERPVLMTEKDAVKCRNLPGPRHWYVPVAASLSEHESARLLDIVDRSMRRCAAGA